MLRRCWIQWRILANKLLAITGSVASIIAVLVSFLPPLASLPWWGVALLVVAAGGVIVLVILEFYGLKGHYVFGKADKTKIEKYMHRWIEHGGRVAIWTRDMSWANNDRTKKLLLRKAQDGELILCLPSPNQLTEDLQNRGAEVCFYGTERLESPASRFTIVYYGRDGSSVAVGRALGDTHVIDEFSAGGHPAYHLAKDLVELVRAKQRQGA